MVARSGLGLLVWIPVPLTAQTATSPALPAWIGIATLGLAAALAVLWVAHLRLRRERDDLIARGEAQLRSVMDNAPEAIVIFDVEAGCFTLFNERATEFFGLSQAELLTLGPAELSPREQPDGRESEAAAQEQIARALAGERPVFEWTHVNANGEPIPCEVRLVRLPGDRDLVRGSMVDISERKRLEREIIEISAHERERIGQDLHEGLGQQLTGIAFLTKAIERKLGHGDDIEPEELEELLRHIRRTVGQTRFLAHGLLPVSFDADGLGSALVELAEDIGQVFGLECDARVSPGVPVDNEELAGHLYQIAREAVTNVARHARAERAVVELESADEGVRLTVWDDGVGIAATDPGDEGLGLRIMRYRSSLIGGRLEILPRPEGGTIVTCLAPASRPGHASAGASHPAEHEGSSPTPSVSEGPPADP